MKKMVAPIIITILLVLYYVFFFVIILAIPAIAGIFKVLLGIVPLGLICICIYVLIERYEEIRSGEEDDLSKY